MHGSNLQGLIEHDPKTRKKQTRMTTSISSEAPKLWMDIGKKFTIEQCHTINIKHDKIGKTGNL